LVRPYKVAGEVRALYRQGAFFRLRQPNKNGNVVFAAACGTCVVVEVDFTGKSVPDVVARNPECILLACQSKQSAGFNHVLKKFDIVTKEGRSVKTFKDAAELAESVLIWHEYVRAKAK